MSHTVSSLAPAKAVISNFEVRIQALLREGIEPLGPRALLEIGNGVDYELFDAAWRAASPPARLAALPAPRLGYTGALAAWIDFELLARLAAAFPHASLVLVGPAVGSAVPLHELRAAHSNVHWLATVPHEELPHFVAAMDFCLIPFRANALTRGVNPNKLYEYFALGKPVGAPTSRPGCARSYLCSASAAHRKPWSRAWRRRSPPRATRPRAVPLYPTHCLSLGG